MLNLTCSYCLQQLVNEIVTVCIQPVHHVGRKELSVPFLTAGTVVLV